MIILSKKTILMAATALCVLPVNAKATTMLSLDVMPQSASDVLLVSSNQQAQDFINKMGDEVVSILGDASLSKAQKTEEFRKLLNSKFDMATIGRFAMGRHWRSASKAQQSEYQKLFKDMIVNVYSSRFSEYNGEGFDVVSARADGKKDFLVSSYIVPASGSKIKVDWRLRDRSGQFKIIDVIIEGVSMSLTQRSDFSSVIQRGGGDVDVLLGHLRK